MRECFQYRSGVISEVDVVALVAPNESSAIYVGNQEDEGTLAEIYSRSGTLCKLFEKLFQANTREN